MKTKKLIGKLMLFLLSFTLISCKTYKNSEVNSIGIIGSADGPTAIYIKVNPNFLIQKSGKNGVDCYSKNGHAVTVLTRQS